MDQRRGGSPSTTAVRDGTRYGSARTNDTPQACPSCSASLASARARYCSAACKQRAYRSRQDAPASPTGPAPRSLRDQLRRLGTLVDHTVYECPSCNERFLGQQRCADCNQFCRALGLGGVCPECDQPILIAELLGLEVTS